MQFGKVDRPNKWMSHPVWTSFFAGIEKDEVGDSLNEK